MEKEDIKGIREIAKIKKNVKYYKKVWCYPNKNYYFWVTLLY